MKLKSFCAKKGIIKTIKSQPIEWEKIFTEHILPDKELTSKVCKNSNLITKKANNSI